MADQKVSGLSAVVAFAIAQEFYVNDAGVSKKITGSQLALGLHQYAYSSATPTGTSNLSGLMAGMGLILTPAITGRVMLFLSAQCYNDSASDGGQCEFRYGTGAAPTNGAALTGTQVGSPMVFTIANATFSDPGSIHVPVSGLTIGTAYWFDFSQRAITGGTAHFQAINFTVWEF